MRLDRLLFNLSLTLSVYNLTATLEEPKSKNLSLLKFYQLNRKVDGWTFYSLITSYSILIVLGVLGNSLVIYVILLKPSMRTVRNLFILNLAISDLLLCLITMPLTLMEILTRYWPLGRSSFFCKIIGTMEAVSIFVSTFSITAIALDRYQVIVNPMKNSLHHFGAILTLVGIWVLSFVLASPMYFYRKIDIPENMNLTDVDLEDVAYCLEDWTIPHGRAMYSIFVLIIQYVLPVVIVSLAYLRICRKLQHRSASTALARRESEMMKLREIRRKKTNSLFIAIAAIYCISWLPLNLCNVIYDIYNPFGDDFQTMIIVFALCHMIGMSSACSNPFLYGWFNDNFRNEFMERLSIRRCLVRRRNKRLYRGSPSRVAIRTDPKTQKKIKRTGRKMEENVFIRYYQKPKPCDDFGMHEMTTMATNAGASGSNDDDIYFPMEIL